LQSPELLSAQDLIQFPALSPCGSVHMEDFFSLSEKKRKQNITLVGQSQLVNPKNA
jgi:hypothetical protein